MADFRVWCFGGCGAAAAAWRPPRPTDIPYAKGALLVTLGLSLAFSMGLTLLAVIRAGPSGLVGASTSGAADELIFPPPNWSKPMKLLAFAASLLLAIPALAHETKVND